MSLLTRLSLDSVNKDELEVIIQLRNLKCLRIEYLEFDFIGFAQYSTQLSSNLTKLTINNFEF
jgi:hypothetical protein